MVITGSRAPVLSYMECGLDDEVKKEPISWDSGGRFGIQLYSASHACNTLCTESIQRRGQSEQQVMGPNHTR